MPPELLEASTSRTMPSMNDDHREDAESDQQIVDRTLARLQLEPTGDDSFVVDPGHGVGSRLFGGLIAAQAVVAMGRTFDAPADGDEAAARTMHSFHGYFLLPGRPEVPMHLDVERVRDGRSFSARRVSVMQKGHVIFQASASFSNDREGPEVQAVDMPSVPAPDRLLDREIERRRRYEETLGQELEIWRSAVEVRLCDPEVVQPGVSRDPYQENWQRVRGALPQDQLIHQALLAYASDRTLLPTARLPFDVGRHRLLTVSLDHAFWIHEHLDMTQWHLCVCRSPVARSGRATILCHYFRADGVCVATVAQEGLVKLRRA